MAAPLIAESYQIGESLRDAEGIAVVGEIFGQLLVAGERREAGLAVLRQSEMAARKLGRGTDADQVAALITEIEKGGAAGMRINAWTNARG